MGLRMVRVSAQYLKGGFACRIERFPQGVIHKFTDEFMGRFWGTPACFLEFSWSLESLPKML
jgi:hypothetical protein